MALTLHVNEADILKWSAYLQQVKQDTPRAVANGLNVYGEGLIRNISQYVADETGLDDDDVAGLIEVQWATPENLSLSIDATEAMTAVHEADWGSRPWDSRDQKQYQKETLVKIVTLSDGHDCLVCQEAAEHSPYSMEEIRNMQAKWADFQGSTSGPAPGVRTNLVHPNAVLEGSRFVSYGHATEMVRAVFAADAIRAETTVGCFTIGPNHPVLTRRGFVPAHALTKGDELLYDRRCDILGESFAVADGSVLHDDFDKMPFVEDAFATLEAAGQGAHTVMATSNDLHGDAIFCQREVDVVRAARGLLRELDPCGIEQFSELGLPFADVQLASKAGLRTLRAFLVTACTTLASFMSIRSLRLALSGGHTGPLDQLLFGGGSQHDALLAKQAVDDRAADVATLGDGINALTSFVKRSNIFRWDRVVAVDHVKFSGLAFDASTATGLYNSDGYVVKNCRCVIQPWYSTRKLPVTTGSSRTPPELFNLQEMARVVIRETKVELKIT